MNTMTHSFIHILRAAPRHRSRTLLALFAFLLCLTIGLRYQSAAASAPAMPTLSGAEAVSYLKEQQLYGSLAEAMNYTLGQQAKLTATDGEAFDYFGISVAIQGETAIVGTFRQTIGEAYVFARTGTTWSLQQKLTAPDGAFYDHFGISVAISGDTLVIGAHTRTIGTHLEQGAAYVFARTGTTWNLQQKLTAIDGAAYDGFGASVAIHGDTLVVGVWLDDIGTNHDQGSAYVFARTGAVWSEQKKLTAADGAEEDNFGVSVAIQGETIVVGAVNKKVGANPSQGEAYVFARTGTTWNQQQKLTAIDGAAGDKFGISVAIHGDTLIVGAFLDDIGANRDQGSAYVFERSNGMWNERQKLTASDGAPKDRFGSAVATVGFITVVGKNQADVDGNMAQGSAYVFGQMSGGGGMLKELHHLRAADGAPEDKFGVSVAINDQTIVVGAYADKIGANSSQGAAYVFANTPPTITPFTPLTLNKGGSPKPFVIANLTDPDQPLDSLTLNVAPLAGSGVTISNISVNPAGQLSAILQASCDATLSTFTLTVMDSFAMTASAPLTLIIGPDIEPPQITCPTPMIAVAPPACPLSTGKLITFNPPTVIDNCPGTTQACNPPSGSIFPVGTTTVTCTAKDVAGNAASCSFAITVYDLRLQDDINPSTVLLVNSQTAQYRLCANGQTYTGTGIVTKRGCTITLTHNASDRRLQASVDTSMGRGNATLQISTGLMMCSITDRDIRNDSTLCQ
jgi:hypothetical protein